MKMITRLKVALPVVLVLLARAVSAQIVINEYSCANLDQFADNYGKHEDWIELYNKDTVAKDLSGYFLSDNKDKPAINWTVQRQITDAPHKVVIEVYDVSPGPLFGVYQQTPVSVPLKCGDWGPYGDFPPCPPHETPLVLRGDADTTLDIQYDPKTKKLSGDVVGDAGMLLSKAGSGGKRGRIKFKLLQPQ